MLFLQHFAVAAEAGHKLPTGLGIAFSVIMIVLVVVVLWFVDYKSKFPYT